MPKYSFCEPACGIGPWHIREVGSEGIKLGGVAKEPLCFSLAPDRKWINGWDLDVQITEHHLEHACPKCVELYRGGKV